MREPIVFLDHEGYQTEEYLQYLRGYDPTKMPWGDFIEIIRQGWWMADWGFVLKRPRNGKRTLVLHTGGSSGNEEIISALMDNMYFFPMCWRMTKVGGHYYFSIPVDTKR